MPHGGGHHGGGHHGGGHHGGGHGGHGGRHGGGGYYGGGYLRPYNYFYSYSPYDVYWPPSTYIVTSDQGDKDQLLDLAKDAHRNRVQSQRNMWLIALLAVILVGAVLLVKK